jgi:hypothetical protein
MWLVKTTIEIPDQLFRRAKSAAAERGVALRVLLTEALADKLRAQSDPERPWMKGFGKLRDLHKETSRINAIIAAEFGKLEPEDLT